MSEQTKPTCEIELGLVHVLIRYKGDLASELLRAQVKGELPDDYRLLSTGAGVYSALWHSGHLPKLIEWLEKRETVFVP